MHGQPLCAPANLANLLAACDMGVVCCKPAEGWGGRGVTVARIDRSGPVVQLENLSAPGSLLPVDAFFDEYLAGQAREGLLLEEYVTQHVVLSAFHGTSVNTLRIIVIQRQHEVEILGAVLRIGRHGAVVDNAEQGGLISEIDLDTGMITGLRDIEVIPTYYERHPDTGVDVRGVRLPHWAACISLSKQLLSGFPHMNYAGIDMAIGPDGPVVIELNPQPDMAGTRIFRSPPAGLLN